MARYLVCITGASGSIYPLRLIAALAAKGAIVHTVCSPWGARVVLEETGRPIGYWLGKVRASGGPSHRPAIITYHSSEDFSAPVSSGSFRLDGTVIAPCSMGTVGSLASGATANLIHRAGAVALKEGWPLVVVPRETPLSLIHIRSLQTLKEAGAIILPAAPSFYSKPQTIEQLVDSVVYRIMDHLGVHNIHAYRWS
ncbi:MAG: UbiX family flavin prenyltransferase [Spirochaetia bacterium]|nr:UbiX family flavin prenyltransferase [Spirochaetia bacterium]